MQVFDGAARLIADNAYEFDQRRSGAHIERICDIRSRSPALMRWRACSTFTPARSRRPNLPYRVVCYTAAWIDLLVPYALNLIGLIIANINGRWMLRELYQYVYYPLALAVVLGTVLDWTPRARRDTFGEGAERAWFYVAIWTVVPTQVINWGAWRFGKFMNLAPMPLARVRLVVCLVATLFFFLLGYSQKLPRTTRHYEGVAAAGV